MSLYDLQQLALKTFAGFIGAELDPLKGETVNPALIKEAQKRVNRVLQHRPIMHLPPLSITISNASGKLHTNINVSQTVGFDEVKVDFVYDKSIQELINETIENLEGADEL